ncbi:MAG: response regulator transcription factor [Terracidiphilus sp.]|jgi:DNA-binding NarL/FixJ family response regulator
MGPNPEIISILLVCQQAMTGELYAQAFNRCKLCRVVARAESVSEALHAVRANEIDVALISSTLMDGPHSGLLALHEIREASPRIQAVILLEHEEDHLVTAAFRAGAKGVFFPSRDGFKSLCRCVKQVSAGQVWANSAQLHEVLEIFSRSAPIQVVSASGEQLLTKREVEVVQLVVDGLTNRLIAKELQLSEHTVRNALFRVFDKLGVSTRVELALYAINHSKPNPANVHSRAREVTLVPTSRERIARVQ